MAKRIYKQKKDHPKNRIAKHILQNDEEYQEMLKLSYRILNRKKSWNIKDEELYATLEKVLFLKAREDNFLNFFENMEQTINAALQLDFSGRVPLSDIVIDGRNIFNYVAVSLNLLMDKVGTSVVSMKAVNSILSAMPNMMVIVTDNTGKIRFMNEYAENLLHVESKALIGKQVQALFDDYVLIERQLNNHMQVKDIKVNLISAKAGEPLIPVTLTVPLLSKSRDETDEFVYQMLKTTTENITDKAFEFARLSHDLLSPLNSISSALHLMEERIKDNNQETLEYVNYLTKSKDLLVETAHKTLSDLNSSKNSAESKLIDFHFVINEIMESLHYMEGVNEICFKRTIVNRNALYSDPAMIYSILQNLISNAIKYRRKNNPDALVHILVQDAGSDIELKIQDNGIGIKQEYLEKIFEKNFRASNTIEGNGFGLFIVKKHIERLYGTIKVASEPGVGSVFTLTFPNRFAPI